MIALREFQEAMMGEAEKAGIKSEEDLNRLVKEIRERVMGERNMRILIDTNVLISAILFPSPNMNRLMDKIALEHTFVLPSHVMEELEALLIPNLKEKSIYWRGFFAKYSYEYVYTPLDINPEDYPEIRDKTDLPILVSAIVAGVDLIITGDKDFFDIKTEDIEIELPVIITPKEFIEGIN